MTRSMPLPGPEQTPGQDGRTTRTLQGGGLGQRGAVRDGGDLGRVDAEPGAQPLPGRLRHHDDLIGRATTSIEHRTLFGCRIFQHGMSDDDRRDVRAFMMSTTSSPSGPP